MKPLAQGLASWIVTGAVAAALLALGATHVQADAGEGSTAAGGLPSFVAEYELRRNNTRAARLERSLHCDDGSCRFASDGQTVGFADLLLRGRIEEWTQFRLSDGEIRPQEYYYRQRARGGNNEYTRLFFNPDTGRVSSRGDERWDAQVEGETMDELLSQLRLMMAVRAGETDMEFSVVEGDGEVDSYRFRVVGRESVDTPAGTYEAVRVERVGGSSRRKTTMWFATELEYIPLVVEHERVGRETYRASLLELKQAP